MSPTEVGEGQQADGDRPVESELPALRSSERSVLYEYLLECEARGHPNHEASNAAEVAASEVYQHGDDG